MSVATRRIRERARLRERILRTAKAIIASEGYDALTIRKIAARIEYSPMALYNHFADKNAILLALAQEAFEDLEKTMPEPGEDPLASLRAGLLAYISFGLEHPDEYRAAFMTPLSPQPESGSAAEQTSLPNKRGGRSAFERLVAAVTACADAGLTDDEPFQAATTLWAAVHGVVSLQLVQQDFPFGEASVFAAYTVDLLLRGLTRPSTSKEPRREASSSREASATSKKPPRR